MNERLIVKNFLCLEDIDIEVKDFLVIIGPQAAGKSLCAKLLYFFRTIFEEIIFYRIRCSLGEPPVIVSVVSFLRIWRVLKMSSEIDELSDSIYFNDGLICYNENHCLKPGEAYAH